MTQAIMIISYGAVLLSLLFAFGELFTRQYRLFLLFISIAIWTLASRLNWDQVTLPLNLEYLSMVAFGYTNTLFYLIFKNIYPRGEEKKEYFILLFLPLIQIPFYLINHLFPLMDPFRLIDIWEVIYGLIALVIYALIIKHYRAVLRQTPKENKAVLVNKLIIIFCIVFFYSNLKGLFINKSDHNIEITLYLCIYYFLSKRYPQFFKVYREEEKKSRYKRSQIIGIDKEEYTGKLKKLMEEGIYKDEDLTQALLAERLDLKPYQLSEFFSYHYETNFHQYINSYRIEEAKKLLLEDSESKVLAVALDTGFKSLSAFYREFKKKTSQTPTEYRKQNS